MFLCLECLFPKSLYGSLLNSFRTLLNYFSVGLLQTPCLKLCCLIPFPFSCSYFIFLHNIIFRQAIWLSAHLFLFICLPLLVYMFCENRIFVCLGHRYLIYHSGSINICWRNELLSENSINKGSICKMSWKIRACLKADGKTLVEIERSKMEGRKKTCNGLSSLSR